MVQQISLSLPTELKLFTPGGINSKKSHPLKLIFSSKERFVRDFNAVKRSGSVMKKVVSVLFHDTILC